MNTSEPGRLPGEVEVEIGLRVAGFINAAGEDKPLGTCVFILIGGLDGRYHKTTWVHLARTVLLPVIASIRAQVTCTCGGDCAGVTASFGSRNPDGTPRIGADPHDPPGTVLAGQFVAACANDQAHTAGDLYDAVHPAQRVNFWGTVASTLARVVQDTASAPQPPTGPTRPTGSSARWN